MARITQNLVNQLVAATAEKATSRIVWDSELRGFGLRITAAGTAAFIYNYRFHGKERRVAIMPRVLARPEWSAFSSQEFGSGHHSEPQP